MGQEIRTLVNEERAAGFYTIYWNGLDSNGNQVASGVYLYRIQVDKFDCSKKMILMK